MSALCLDPSGARVVTGGYDYEVQFWDFGGMDSTHQSFRTIKPCERWVEGRKSAIGFLRVSYRIFFWRGEGICAPCTLTALYTAFHTLSAICN